jgi:hypothetical protein
MSWYFPMLGSPSVYIFLGSHISIQMDWHTGEKGHLPNGAVLQMKPKDSSVQWSGVLPIGFNDWESLIQDQVCPKMKRPQTSEFSSESWNRSCGSHVTETTSCPEIPGLPCSRSKWYSLKQLPESNLSSKCVYIYINNTRNLGWIAAFVHMEVGKNKLCARRQKRRVKSARDKVQSKGLVLQLRRIRDKVTAQQNNECQKR